MPGTTLISSSGVLVTRLDPSRDWKASTRVNPSCSHRPRRSGSRAAAWRTLRSAWRQASISAELTPLARMCPSHRELCADMRPPLRASGQNSILGDGQQQLMSSQLAIRSSIQDLRSPRMSGRSARRPVRAFPWRTSTPQRRASAAQPRRYHPSRRPERSRLSPSILSRGNRRP
ncbi:hypothetical protein BANRA_05153 [Klebsiella pneumoniae]|nr:hypothetical protein BANRA_05153 [Klebsiella pneumoniae]